MTPAAVLSILVKTQGVQAASTQLVTLDKSARKADTGIGKAEKTAKRSSKTFSVLGTAAKSAGILVGAAGFAKSLQIMNAEYREAQKTGAQTNAVLKSTGDAAGVTKKHIEDLANSISKKAGIDDEAIQSSENLLLTFTKVRNETGKGNKIFDRATQVVTDMSVALGQSGKSSAIQLGKALQDPIKGITALRRVGVNFNQQQADQIKKMVENGDLLGAQKRILRELTTEFGGSAAAQATAGDKLRVSLNNLAEAAGKILVPAFDKAAEWLTKVIDAAMEGKGIATVIVPAFEAVRDAVKEVLGQGKALADWFKTHEDAAAAAAGAVGALAAAFIALKAAAAISTSLSGITAALGAIGLATGPVLLVVAAIAALTAGFVYAYQKSEAFHKFVDAAFDGVVATATAAWAALKSGAIAAFPTIKQAAEDAFHGLVAAAGWVKQAFTDMVDWVSQAMSDISKEVHQWDVLFAVVKTAVDAIKIYLTPAFAAIAAVVKVAMAVIKSVISTGWDLVKVVFKTAFATMKTLVEGGLAAISGVIKVIGGIFKGDFGQIWDGIKDIFRAAFHTILGLFKAQVGLLTGAAGAIGSGIVDGISKTLSTGVDAVRGFINAIIKIINKIPFLPDIGLIGASQVNTNRPGNVDLSKTTGRLAKGGAFGMTGGTVNKPMVMMGEEAPRHPEYVIPTNPAYRKQAQSLLMSAAGSVGFQAGGVLSGVGNLATGALKAVTGGAAGLIGKLPGTDSLPDWMKGMGKTILGKVKDYITSKVTDLLPGGGDDAGASTTGLVPQVQRAVAWARAHGWKGSVISGFRSRAEQAVLYARYLAGGNLAAKPGSSEHEKGRAVDVSDPEGFRRALANAPANSTLKWFGPGDTPHFSVSGHKKGGVIGMARGGVIGMAGGGVTGNVKAAWQFLIGKGLTPAQAAGIIGYMQGESGKGLSPTALNQKSGAFGIAQWLGGRKSALMAKKDPRSLKTQLGHLWSELQGPEAGAFSAIKGAHSIPAAISAWAKFERPGPGEANVAGRTANARNVFKSLKGVGAKGAAGKKAAPEKVSNYEMYTAIAEQAIAQAESTTRVSDDITANTALRDAVTGRIKTVRQALKKPNLRPATRLRLTQELTGLTTKHTELQGKLKDLRPPTGIDRSLAIAGIGSDIASAHVQAAQATETLADDLGPLQEKANALGTIFELTQKKFGAGSVEAQQAFADLTQATADLTKTTRDAIVQGFQAPIDAANAALVAAKVLTPGFTGDDMAALQQGLDAATAGFNDAMARGDVAAITDFGGEVLGLRDAIKQLGADIEANTAAQRDMEKQLKEQAQRAALVSQTQYGVLSKAIADVASGQIGGKVGLGFMTPGFAGGGSRY